MNNGGPAFPTGTAFQGMTLRDYFAAKAMQSLTANSTNPKEIAQAAYIVADAMLEARKK
jgi:hypothetical protein